MARGPCTFRQHDVTRALRATVAAGIEVQRIEIDKDGKIVVVTGKLPDQPRDRRPPQRMGYSSWLTYAFDTFIASSTTMDIPGIISGGSASSG